MIFLNFFQLGKTVRLSSLFLLPMHMPSADKVSSALNVAEAFICRNLEAESLEEEFQVLHNPLSISTSPSQLHSFYRHFYN